MITGVIIETAYHGPTDHRDSRISATCKRDSDRTFKTFITYKQELDGPENHLLAAEKLMEVMDKELAFINAEPFRVIGRGHGGRSDRGYYFLINRGGA